MLATLPFRHVFPILATRRTFVMLTLASAGFAPITALAVAIFGWVPLHVGAPLWIGSSLLAALAAGLVEPRFGRVALRGFAIGLVAVTLYDAFRLPFVVTGLWGDFIPRIGGWLLDHAAPNATLGYLYRYLGDGGGMSATFCVVANWLPFRLHAVPAGIAFGVFVWLCLMLTLLLSPNGQSLLFVLTPKSVTLSLIGHLIYGAVVGAGYARVVENSS